MTIREIRGQKKHWVYNMWNYIKDIKDIKAQTPQNPAENSLMGND